MKNVLDISAKLYLVLFILFALIIGISLQLIFQPDGSSHGQLLLYFLYFFLTLAFVFILFLVRDFRYFLVNFKESKVKIAESQEKFKLAFMTGMDANFISRLEDGTLLEVNDYFCQLFGYTREECVGQTSATLGLYVNPGDRVKSVKDILSKGHIRDIEIDCRKKNGEIFTIFFSTSLFKVNDQLHVFGVIRDITEQKKVQEIIISSEERYRSLFFNSKEGIFLSVPDGEILSANPEACRLLGYSEEEICVLGRNGIADLADPNLVSALKKREIFGSYKTELVFIRKDGTKFPVEISSTLFKNAKGENRSVIFFNDITQRKKAEDELAVRREQLSLFIEYSPAALAMLDTDMRYIAVSNRWMIDYNLGTESIIGKSHYEVFPEIGDDWKETHQRSLQGSIEKKEEDSFLRADGTVSWLRWEIRPWHNASGEIGGIIMLTEVITENVLNRERLMKSRERYQDLVSKINVGIVLSDPNSKILFANQSACNLFGLSESQLLGMSSFDSYWIAIHEDGTEYDRNLHPIPQSIASKKPVRNVVMGVFVPAKNDLVWLMVNSIPQLDSHEQVKEVITTFEDITIRFKSEEKIRESEERFRALSDNILMGVYIIKDNKFSYINPRLAEIYGYEPEELIGESPLKVIHPDHHDFISENIRKRNSGVDFPTQYEYKGIRKNGESVIIEVRGSRVLLGKEYVLIGSILDITDRRKNELAVIESEEKYRYLFQNNPSFIIIWDLDTFNILEVNDAIIQNYGYTREEWMKMTVFDYRPKGDVERINEFREMMLKGEQNLARGIWRHLKKNGEEIIMDIASHKITYQNRPAIMSLARDVTDQVKAEKALKSSEEKFHSLVDYAADAILMVGQDERIFDVNKIATELFQESREQLIGKSFLTILYQEEELAERAFWSRLKDNVTISHERKLFRKDGTWLIVEIRAKMLPDGSGAIAILRDISDRKRMERELVQNEVKQRALIENISDTILLINEDMKIVYQSSSFIRTAGVYIDEANDKSLLSFIHPDNVQGSMELFQNSKNLPGQALEFQYRIRHKDGHYIWVEGTINNLLEEESVKAFILNYRDITQRKSIEERLALSNSIVNSTDDAIISKTQDGLITSWNRGAERILGYSSNEAIGQSIYFIIPEKYYGEERLISERILKGNAIEHLETERKRKDGKLINVSLTISPIKDDSGKVIGSSKIIRDVTEKKKMELENEKIMNDLLQRNRDLEQFSYIISHNLRLPVANIMGISDYILSTDVNTAEKEQLNMGLSKSVHALDGVIRDLNFILQKKREISEKNTLVRFQDLCEEIKLSIANLIHLEGVIIQTDFSAVAEMTTLKSYLYSIFYNLISNSIKYKQTQITPEITIRSEKIEDKIILTFKDNGLGIDMVKRKDQIFGLYKRFHSHTEGKGMGLFMVKMQVETLGGKISVDSEVNKGTEFRIEFDLTSKSA